MWVQTSESRRKWVTSLPRSTLVAERKDEFQWMSLALVGDKKAIRPLYQAPRMECTFPSLLFLYCHSFSSFSWLRRTRWDSVKQDVSRRRVKKNRLTQVRMEGVCGSPKRSGLVAIIIFFCARYYYYYYYYYLAHQLKGASRKIVR